MSTDLVATEAERKLIAAARAGEPAVYSAADEPIRASIVAALAARLRADWPLHHSGLRIRGARIAGPLDLSFTTLSSPLELLECDIAELIALVDASVRTIRLSGSSVPGIDATRLAMRGALVLDGLRCTGEIRLWDANIEGRIEAVGASFENPGGVCFDGTRLTVSGTVHCTAGPEEAFRSTGELLLAGAHIGGALSFEGARLDNPDGNSLVADGVRTGGPVLLRAGFQARGTVRLLYAEVGSTLECDGASIAAPGGHALYADGLKTGSSVHLRAGFDCRGEVSLFAAQIGGVLDCGGGAFQNPGGMAIRANGVVVRGGVLLGEGFRSEGALGFVGASIGADFVCDSAVFENPGAEALIADGMATRGPVLMRRLRAQGQTRLLLADIGSSLECDGASLDNGEEWALVADGMTTRGPVLLRRGFHARGPVNLSYARIGGALDCSESIFESSGAALHAGELRTAGAVFFSSAQVNGGLNLWSAAVGGDLHFGGSTLRGEVVLTRCRVEGDLVFEEVAFEGAEDSALTAERMTVGGSLVWRRMPRPPQGLVNLADAAVGRLVDDEKSWPAAIRIENFSYDSISHGAPLAGERLAWLRRQVDFSPGPYEQAVQVLRRMGYEKDARRIAMAKQDDLRRRGRLSRPAWLWNAFLGATIGHGYQVWRASLVLLALIVAGAFVFDAIYERGLMLPDEPGTRSELPAFDPLVYSIDVGLPIIDLHQESAWVPLKRAPGAWPSRAYFWFHIGLGWLATTLVATGLTGLIKKE